MKSLIPWKKQKLEMANSRNEFDNWLDRSFNEHVFSISELLSEKNRQIK